MNDRFIPPQIGPELRDARGPVLPISSIGPDCYLEIFNLTGGRHSLLVRRDENVSGWLVSQLPGISATVTCNGQQLTAAPDYSGAVLEGRRFGTLEITDIFAAGHQVHVTYPYQNEEYYETFPNGQS